MPAYASPHHRLGGTALRTAAVAALSLALAACAPPSGPTSSASTAATSSATASATESPVQGSPAPDGSAPAPSSGTSTGGTGAAAGGDAADGSAAGGGAGADTATFSAATPERRPASAPDAGACALLREEAVRGALGSAAPATLAPVAGDDESIDGYAGAVQHSCTMKLGPEPRHSVSVVWAQFPDAASARAYGVAPRGLTTAPVSGVGESAAFGQTTNLPLASTVYYLYAGRGADVFSFRLGQTVDNSGKVLGLDAAAAREALVRIAGAAGL